MLEAKVDQKIFQIFKPFSTRETSSFVSESGHASLLHDLLTQTLLSQNTGNAAFEHWRGPRLTARKGTGDGASCCPNAQELASYILQLSSSNASMARTAGRS